MSFARWSILLFCLVPACGGSVASDPTTDSSVSDTFGSDTIGSDTTPLPDTPTPIDKSCTMAGMCVLVPASCCGYCGMPTKTDQIALPRDKAAEYRTRVCSADGGFGCPECAGMADPNLQAFCRGGSCVFVEVPKDDVSACATDADCELAQGVCCGPCGGELTLTAVAKTKVSEFMSQICDPRADCAGCPVPSPTKSVAKCDPSTKHCYVQKP